MKRCLLCGRAGRPHHPEIADRGSARAHRRSILRCSGCALYWLDPQPRGDEFIDHYGNAYYTHAAAAGTPPPLPGRLSAAALARRHGYPAPAGAVLTRLISRSGVIAEGASAQVRFLDALPGGRLLDVGCGNGEFLATMQALGWSVLGVDPDARAVECARPEIRASLHTGTVEDLDLPARHFDAITLHHVIEHLPDPIATLRHCARLLRPGGRLVAITPNATSLGSRVFGRNWLHWDPPRHTFIFTRRSLAEIARRAGLHVLEQRSIARGARWTFQESRRIAAGTAATGGPPGRARGAGAVAFQLAEHALQQVAGLGEELVMIATVEQAAT